MARRLLIAYLIALVFFAWGYAMVRYQVFPWRYVFPVEQEIIKFVVGTPEEETSVTEKIANDLNIKPTRHLYPYKVESDRLFNTVHIEGLNDRRAAPMVYSTDQKTSGYKILYGIFDYEDAILAGILVDDDDQVIHRWIVDTDQMQHTLDDANAEDGGNRELMSNYRKLSQGLEVLPDGSIIIVDGPKGNGMHKLEFCGDLVWSNLGTYHHVVTLDEDDNSLWSFQYGHHIVEVDADTGETLREILFSDITQANPDLSIFTPRRVIKDGKKYNDPLHENDIDALPARLAAAFPMFEAGDLLISHRTTNLVFVMDPDTLKIKWWRSGMIRRQHDPDWIADGTISIYDNNMRENEEFERIHRYDGDHVRYSKILRINPETYNTWISYAGEKDNFYNGARGNHQVLPNGNMLLVSSYQGRIMEVTENGETVFDFVNVYDDEDVLIVTEAKWVPQDYFQFDVSDPDYCQQ